MPFRIEFARAAKADLRALGKSDQVKVLDRIVLHLSHQPTSQSKSRIKALRPGTFPPYRLRVEEFRVYYDIDDAERLVIIYGVVPKAQSEDWLNQSSHGQRKREKQ
jgi:mRNA-degrading endonuclease RelE of RelBE toxin-antitoxin system